MTRRERVEEEKEAAADEEDNNDDDKEETASEGVNRGRFGRDAGAEEDGP